MKYIIPTMLSVFVLAGCGGGSTLTADIDRDYASDNSIATDVLKEYSNGNAVVAFKGDLQDGAPAGKPRYYFVLSENVDAAVDTFNGVVVWENVDKYLDEGNIYGIIREGANAKGQSVYVDTVGRNLNLSGTEYASFSFVRVGETPGYVSAGTTATNLPSGIFNYEGGAIIGLGSIEEGDGDSFSLTANFENNEVSFTALTENLYASASGLKIDNSSGSFSGDGGTIGERDSTFAIPATVIGAFAGTNAGGVHGVVYPTLDDENHGYAVFLAER